MFGREICGDVEDRDGGRGYIDVFEREIEVLRIDRIENALDFVFSDVRSFDKSVNVVLVSSVGNEGILDQFGLLQLDHR